ncbi:MAG: hypothetical protein WCL50_00310 [Spirochaetota bacterium]
MAALIGTYGSMENPSREIGEQFSKLVYSLGVVSAVLKLEKESEIESRLDRLEKLLRAGQPARESVPLSGKEKMNAKR